MPTASESEVSQRATQDAELVPMPPRSGRLTLRQAAVSVGMTDGGLLNAVAAMQAALLDRPRQPHDLPAPAYPDGASPRWARREFTLWSLKMGWSARGVEGVPVIGYLGLAVLLGVQQQSLRKAALTAGRGPTDMPPPRFRMAAGDSTVAVALFDRAEVLRWAVQTGRLHHGAAAAFPPRFE